MEYKTTKDLLGKVVLVASVRAYRNGAIITGSVDGITYKHQFGKGSEAERKLLALCSDALPVWIKLVRKARSLDLEFQEEVYHA